jgi:hypothetical protein
MTSAQARSLTALCMGTTVFMSEVWGLWFLRAIAAKNCASDGYTHFPSVALGIEETSRSVDNLGSGEGVEVYFVKSFENDDWA